MEELTIEQNLEDAQIEDQELQDKINEQREQDDYFPEPPK